VEEKKTTVIPKVTASEKGKIKPKQRIQRDEGMKSSNGTFLGQVIWNCSVGHSGLGASHGRERAKSVRKVGTERVRFP